jgi:hypothetical protein
MLLSVGFWYDFIHIPVLIAIVHILIKNRAFLKFRYILIWTGIIIVWIVAVSLLGFAYTEFEFELLGLYWIYDIIGTTISGNISFYVLFALILLANYGILYIILRQPKPLGTTIFITD